MKRTAVTGLLLLVACSSGDGANEVTMSAHAFEPATITIQAGESIDWKNTSSEQHTVTADEETLPDGAPFFSSGDASDEKAANANLPAELIEVGKDYKFTFDSPGTYSYYCILHRSDGMEGKVVVEP
jgi:plastocyanin